MKKTDEIHYLGQQLTATDDHDHKRLRAIVARLATLAVEQDTGSSDAN